MSRMFHWSIALEGKNLSPPELAKAVFDASAGKEVEDLGAIGESLNFYHLVDLFELARRENDLGFLRFSGNADSFHFQCSGLVHESIVEDGGDGFLAWLCSHTASDAYIGASFDTDSLLPDLYFAVNKKFIKIQLNNFEANTARGPKVVQWLVSVEDLSKLIPGALDRITKLTAAHPELYVTAHEWKSP
jgi:hypothetical protein